MGTDERVGEIMTDCYIGDVIFDECVNDAPLNKIARIIDGLSKYKKEELKAIRSLNRRR